jgi:hypothetical protein
MKSSHLKLLALLSVSVAALGACSDAIYSTIEVEKKTATNTLSQTLSVFGVAVSPAGTYYVAAGAIFQGTLSGTTVSWNPNSSSTSRPWNPTGLLCNAMALFGSNLYGGFVTQSGTPSLYQSSPSPFTFASGAGTEVPMLSAGEQVTMLSSTSTNLFMGGATLSGNSYIYQLDYSTTGTSWLATGLTGAAYPFVGVGFDGTSYWTASGSTLYKGGTPTTFSIHSGIAPGTVNGVFCSSPYVFVATKSSGIYYSGNGGTTWSHINPDVVGTATVGYLTVAGPVDSGNDKYLVGSEGYGYYTLSLSAGTVSRFGDSTIALYSASVSHISLDPANSVVLMGTNAKGLWRGVFDSTGALASGQSWINE